MVEFKWPVIGHQPVQKYLQTVIRNQRLHHAYLFYGPEGLGKSLVAEYFIQSLYCSDQQSKPCGQCTYCRQITNGVHPDVIYLDKLADKKNITIEQVRQVRQQIQRSSFANSYKVVLIKQAHTLSLAASNSLLKILEEPTGQTIFILITSTLDYLPSTILSRAQLIKFSPLSVKELEQAIIAKGFNKKQAHLLARLSHGLPGKILPLLSSPAELNNYQQQFKDILKIISADLNQRFKAIEKISAQLNAEASKLKTKEFLNLFFIVVRDLFLIKNNCYDKISCGHLEGDLLRTAEQYNLTQLADILSSTQQVYNLVDQNINLRLALESLMLKLAD